MLLPPTSRTTLPRRDESDDGVLFQTLLRWIHSTFLFRPCALKAELHTTDGMEHLATQVGVL